MARESDSVWSSTQGGEGSGIGSIPEGGQDKDGWGEGTWDTVDSLPPRACHRPLLRGTP